MVSWCLLFTFLVGRFENLLLDRPRIGSIFGIDYKIVSFVGCKPAFAGFNLQIGFYLDCPNGCDFPIFESFAMLESKLGREMRDAKPIVFRHYHFLTTRGFKSSIW